MNKHMNNTETPIKECKLLQYLIQTGDETDTFRMAVLQCVCEYHYILEPEKYLNNEAVLRYVYQPWEREDELVVELYSRKEYDPVETYEATPHGVNSILRQSRTIAYTQAYTLVTPVSVIDKYIRGHFTILDGTYFWIRKKS